MLVFMMGSPTPATEQNGTVRELFWVGRHKIYGTPFEHIEKDIREQLQSMLGKFGFNRETDTHAILVNRIPQGYAYSYLSLDDPERPEGGGPTKLRSLNLG